MTLQRWRYPIVDTSISREVRVPGTGGRMVSWLWHPIELVDYYPLDEPLWRLFRFEPSLDGDDEIMICPCGVALGVPGALGDRVDDAQAHVHAKHPAHWRRLR